MTKLSKTTLWRERREGRLRAIKVGRALRFPVSEVQRWIDQRLKELDPNGVRADARARNKSPRRKDKGQEPASLLQEHAGSKL